MVKYPIKGVSLAAGLATRLKPLSDHLPKAEVPILGIPSLYYTLLRLEELGLSDVAVNTHHLPDRVEVLLKKYQGPLKLQRSYEPDILGTGGCFNPLKKWFGDETILYANPDTFTDLDVGAFVEAHFTQKNFVTIAVLTDNPKCQRGTVWFDASDRVAHLGKNAPHTSLSCGYGLAYFLISPEIFRYLPPAGFSSLPDAINAAIKAGESVGIFKHQGYMRDFGDSIKDYFLTHQELCANNRVKAKFFGMEILAQRYGLKYHFEQKYDTTFIDQNIKIEPSAQLEGDCFLFGSYKVPKGAYLKNALLFGEAFPKSSLHLENVVVLDQLVCSF